MSANWNLTQLKSRVWNSCVEMADQTKKATNRAAEVAAAKCTELTGRETTASEVKQVAVVVGAVALGLGTLATVANSRRGLLGDLAGGVSSGSTDGGWGSDFESQAARSFAENGHSLNYYTPHVDDAGTMYFEP